VNKFNAQESEFIENYKLQIYSLVDRIKKERDRRLPLPGRCHDQDLYAPARQQRDDSPGAQSPSRILRRHPGYRMHRHRQGNFQNSEV